MSRWRSGRWLGGLEAGKKQFAEVLFVFEGAQASTGKSQRTFGLSRPSQGLSKILLT